MASRPVSSLASRMIGTGIPVFMLHRIILEEDPQSGAITPEYLRQCLNYLVDHHYSFISLEQLATALANGESMPSRAVVFTMDDGFADQAEITAPIFLEFGCPLTFFVITGMLDQNLWPWDAKISWITETTHQSSLKTHIGEQAVTVSLNGGKERRLAKRTLLDLLRKMPAIEVHETVDRLASTAGVELPETPPESYRPMDWNMARDLEKQGVRFAPHSVSHQILSRLDKAALQYEVHASWNTLQRELNNPLKAFCYPTGRCMDYGQREIDLLRKENFICAVSTVPEIACPTSKNIGQLYNLPRLALPHDIHDFIQYCTWIEYAKQSNRTDRNVSERN